MAADDLMLDQHHIEAALGENVRIEPTKRPSAMGSVGSLLGSTAVSTAFRSFAGMLHGESSELPIAVGSLALVFDSESKAGVTFDHVAQAAHLRTRIGECLVAVETTTGANGLVSYWGYVSLRSSILVLTLDTLDPQALSMSDFRTLVTLAAEHLEAEAA